MGNALKISIAFLREGVQKAYVQRALKENSKLIIKLLEQEANLKVRGDAARMARDVSITLGHILTEIRGVSPEIVEEMVKKKKIAQLRQISRGYLVIMHCAQCIWDQLSWVICLLDALILQHDFRCVRGTFWTVKVQFRGHFLLQALLLILI